jgi:hypothetical protein
MASESWPTPAFLGSAHPEPGAAGPDVPLTAQPPPASDQPASDRAVETRWWEDPHFRLDWLTPGQRYTLALVVLLMVLLLRFGLPLGPSGLRGVVDSGRSAPSARSEAIAAPDPGSPVSTSPLGLGTSSSFSSALPSAPAGILNPLPGETANVPAASGSIPPAASGSNPPAPSGSASGASGSPTPSASTCPVSLPTTDTPIDSLSAELNALCEELLAQDSGTVPTGSLPGGASSPALGGAESPAPGAATPAAREEWAFVDSPIGASGVSDPNWPFSLSAEMAGKNPIVTVGLVQSGSVLTSLVSTLGKLVQDGAVVQALLVPQPSAAGGPQGFGSWVAQALAILKPVDLVEIGTGSAPTGSNASTVAAYTAAGLAAARGASAKIATGVLWLDGGTSSDDGAVWSSLASTDAWSSSSFMARALNATAACSSQSGFATLEHLDPAAAALPNVSEAVPGSAPTGGSAAESSCMKNSMAQDPAASQALWRLWQGPAS